MFALSSAGIQEQQVIPATTKGFQPAKPRDQRDKRIEFGSEFEAKEEWREPTRLPAADLFGLGCDIETDRKVRPFAGARRESKCSTFSCGPYHLRFTKDRRPEPLLEQDLGSELSSMTSVDVGNLGDFSDFEYDGGNEDDSEDAELIHAFSEKLNFSPIGKTLKYQLLPRQSPSPVQTAVQINQRSQIRSSSFRLFNATVLYRSDTDENNDDTLLEDRDCYSPVSVPPSSSSRSEFFDSWDDYTGKLLNCAKDKLAQ